MNATEIKPRQAVWIVFNGYVIQKVVKDVCTGDGRPYAPQHGDDCYVRWDRRNGRWVKHDTVFLTESAAKVELSRRLRAEAAALLKQAEELDCETDACPDAHTCRHGIDN